ncbi:hypothetical protein BOX30_03210 [Leptospirillum ferriphilum]|nr:hypothetical protein BOX30_03210 [Leptospirillum ferriphilum]
MNNLIAFQKQVLSTETPQIIYQSDCLKFLKITFKVVVLVKLLTGAINMLLMLEIPIILFGKI